MTHQAANRFLLGNIDVHGFDTELAVGRHRLALSYDSLGRFEGNISDQDTCSSFFGEEKGTRPAYTTAWKDLNQQRVGG